MNKLLIISGPTATGKTKFAAHLARRFDGELISADSRQVYRGMDLTTGKDRVDVPTWGYDVVDPDEEFSVSHWVKLAKRAISDIQSRNKLPIVVGGTGLYIKALLEPLQTINIPPNKKLRKKLQKLLVNALQKMISRGDMNDSDWNNPRRLIRKIEVLNFKRGPLAKQQGVPLSNYDSLIIGLTAPIAKLDARIDERMMARKAAGIEEEIVALRSKYRANLPAMSAINLNEHAYARRQLTWFKKQKDIHWFDITKEGWMARVEKLVDAWYTTK
ncbi:MAG TPA: tRNA (adenosine(37)-N6)-dimethylallyltransferase MiaA [Patescibacteria group bacterium]|nr:tRNA (adenosine(37)-N6)-dimethylallyltransferase MiaA [Patescibacteria group bacterium]